MLGMLAFFWNKSRCVWYVMWIIRQCEIIIYLRLEKKYVGHLFFPPIKGKGFWTIPISAFMCNLNLYHFSLLVLLLNESISLLAYYISSLSHIFSVCVEKFQVLGHFTIWNCTSGIFQIVGTLRRLWLWWKLYNTHKGVMHPTSRGPCRKQPFGRGILYMTFSVIYSV